MNLVWRIGVTVGCWLLVLGCGSAPPEAGSEGSQSAETSEPLDGSCSLTLGDSGGYVTAADGGYLYAGALGQCADQASLEFRFSAKDPRNHALPAQDFLPYPQGFWNLLPGSPEGTYALSVEMRRAGSSEIVVKSSAKKTLGRVCAVGWVSLNPSFAEPGDPVVIQPLLSCPPDIVGQWNVTITKPGGGSMTLPWTTDTTTTWNTAGLLPGTATVQVAVRNLGNTVADATSKVTYTLGDTCSAATLTATGAGNSRLLDATAICTGAGVPSYAYSVVAPDGTSSVLRDFSPDSSFVWDATGLNGTFSVRVDVRAEQSPTQPLTGKSLKVAVGDACTKVVLADTWGTHQRAEPLPLVASVACGSAELSFQLRSVNESSWTTVCPYSPRANCVLDLTARPAGDYLARALVRKVGSIAASDAASAARDFVLLDGSALIRTLPRVAGSTPSGNAVRPDGRWVVGSGAGASGVFRWSRTNGYSELPSLITNNYSGEARAVANSGIVVGALPGQSQVNQAVLWNGNNITQLLPPAGGATYTQGVSADGRVAVGYGANGGLDAFRWTAKSGLVDIGAGFRLSSAADVSADGSVVVGNGYPVGGSNAVPTRWTASTGMVALPLLPGCIAGEARAVSQDGNVVVGACWLPGAQFGYRWTLQGGLESLGALPGAASRVSVFSTNGDGSVIVGNVVLDNEAIAVIWTANTGFRLLSEVLAESGTDLSGWTLSGATDISSDGKTIVGQSDSGGLLITLP